MILKPQDTLLAIKYWSITGQRRISIRELADSIGISFSEVSKSTKRLLSARLVVERENGFTAEKGALFEWLAYGVRYAYPVEGIGYGRGMATSWNCPYLESELVPPNPPMVWSSVGGDTEGAMIKPFHKAVPFAASNDQSLYQALAIVEAIRSGKPRELKIARDKMSLLLERR